MNQTFKTDKRHDLREKRDKTNNKDMIEEENQSNDNLKMKIRMILIINEK